jgi:hypothetical protein
VTNIYALLGTRIPVAAQEVVQKIEKSLANEN